MLDLRQLSEKIDKEKVHNKGPIQSEEIIAETAEQAV